MRITFDPPKRLKTLSERGIDFAIDAQKVFAGRFATSEDKRFDYGEKRYSTVGWIEGRMTLVICTPRGEAHHIISMRYVHAREAKRLLRDLFGEA